MVQEPECPEEHSEHTHSLESTESVSPIEQQQPIRLAIAALYRGVRDEVCAWCFQLAPSNKKVLAWNVQLYNDDFKDTYLTFCSRACRKRWCEEFDEECEVPYLAATRYVRTTFAWPADPYKMAFDAGKKDSPPSTKEIEEAWEAANAMAMSSISRRMNPAKSTKKVIVPPPPTQNYATLLFFLLDATLFAMRYPLSWSGLVAGLNMPTSSGSSSSPGSGSSPSYRYATKSRLADTTAAYVHLVNLLPVNILLSGALSRSSVEAALEVFDTRVHTLWGLLPAKKFQKRRAELLGVGVWAPMLGEEAIYAQTFSGPYRGQGAFSSYQAAWAAGQ